MPWGVDVPVQVRPAGRPIPEQGGTIGIVGRIEPRKRQRLLVQAMAHVRRTRPLARLDIIGPVADQAYAAAMAEDIVRLDLDRSVRVRGHVRDVGPRLVALDLLVSLSRDEGQGMAILEGMAAGVPVAATRSAGVEDYFVDGRTGMDITATTARAIGGHLVRTLEAPARLRAVTRHASRMVRTRYRWATTLSRIEALYEAVARQP